MGDQQRQYLYRICVRGKLDSSWSDWFSGLEVIPGYDKEASDLTCMTGYVSDQSHLRGILNRIWNLNLVLVSLDLIEESKNSLSGKKK